MASIKTVLYKKQNTNGQSQIKLSFNRAQYIDAKYWDEKNQKVKKSHPNSTRLNNYISKKLSEANDKLLEVESGKGSFSAQIVTDHIKSGGKSTTFFKLANTYLKQLEGSGKFSRISSDRPRINHLKKFLKGRDITFPEIKGTLLIPFQAFLKKTRGNSDCFIVNTLVVIRTIFQHGHT